jgi:hypothetical protein
LSVSNACAISSGPRISKYDDVEAERPCLRLNLAHLQKDARIPYIGHDRDAAETRDDLAQKFKSLSSEFATHGRQASHVAARPRHIR